MHQKNDIPASQSIRLANKRYTWLESVRISRVDEISKTMRKNHTGIEVREPLPEIPEQEIDGTYVDWVYEEFLGGQLRPCNPFIRFKCLLFSNNVQR